MEKFDLNKLRNLKNETYGRTPTEAVEEIIKVINKEIKQINKSDVFLDIGSGTGEVVNDFQKIAKIKAFGIEKVKVRHDQAVLKFPTCNLIHGNIVDYLEILKEATIVYLNDICFDNDLVKFCFDNSSKNTIFICLKATTPIVLIKNSKLPLKKITNCDTTINKMKAKVWIIQK